MAFTFDGITKVISLSNGTTNVSVRDVWSRWVEWFQTSDNSKYQIAMTQLGGNDIDPSSGTRVPIYIFLQNGWQIKPQEANHTLTVGDGILLVEGGGDPFRNTNGSFIVRINYQQPVQAISFNTGSSGGGSGTADWTEDEKRQIRYRLGLDGTTTVPASVPDLSTFDATTDAVTVDNIIDSITTKVDDLHKIAGLNPATPLTVTPNLKQAGSIVLDISGNPTSSVTVERQ